MKIHILLIHISLIKNYTDSKNGKSHKFLFGPQQLKITFRTQCSKTINYLLQSPGYHPPKQL
ncbi:hypothetical protein pb186bvf_003126 [Paramecium bursaria]